MQNESFLVSIMNNDALNAVLICVKFIYDPAIYLSFSLLSLFFCLFIFLSDSIKADALVFIEQEQVSYHAHTMRIRSIYRTIDIIDAEIVCTVRPWRTYVPLWAQNRAKPRSDFALRELCSRRQ